MQIAIPKELKNHEYRIGSTPAFVSAFAQSNHEVRVNKAACAVPFTCTNNILPYLKKLAELGYKIASLDDHDFLPGMNVYIEAVTNEEVAHDLGYDYIPPDKRLKNL